MPKVLSSALDLQTKQSLANCQHSRQTLHSVQRRRSSLLDTERSVRANIYNLYKSAHRSSHLQSNQQYSSILQVLANNQISGIRIISLSVTLAVLLRVSLSNYQSSSQILYSAQPQQESNLQIGLVLDPSSFEKYSADTPNYIGSGTVKLESLSPTQVSPKTMLRGSHLQHRWCSRKHHLQPRRKTGTILHWNQGRSSHLSIHQSKVPSSMYLVLAEEVFTQLYYRRYYHNRYYFGICKNCSHHWRRSNLQHWWSSRVCHFQSRRTAGTLRYYWSVCTESYQRSCI